jgi:hypothetical protein
MNDLNQPNRQKLRNGFAFLLAATGLGLCGYAGLLWHEQPHYSGAEIEKSVELNLVLDLARDGKRAGDLDKITLDQKRRATWTEVEAELENENHPVKGWFIAGLILLLFAAIQIWLVKRPPH